MEFISPDLIVFLLLFTPVLLTVMLGIVIYFYERLQKELKRLKDEQQKLIEKANQEYEEIIKSANKKADQIISSSITLNEKIKQEASEAYEKALEKALEKLNQENINILNNISKDIEKHTALEYAKLQGDLEEYKKERIKKLEENIYDLLLEVSKQTIGKALSFDEHEELILDALNKAKKEKGLS